jgi:transmembrane exosortase EpsH
MVDGMPAIARRFFGQFKLATWLPRLVFLGPASFLFIFTLQGAVVDISSLPTPDALHAMHLDAFQFLAWAVAFYLLGRLEPDLGWRDIAGAGAICLIGMFNSLAGLAALSFFLAFTGDIRRRAAGTVFAALFAQQAIVPIIFDALVSKLIMLDAMMVGTAVKLTVADAIWQGNIITMPSGHAIEIVAGCCSFRNVSLAALSWVALTKLERPDWRPLDLIVLLAAAGGQFLFNAVRIYLMAQSFDMFLYWHNGPGSRIFSICASAAAIFINAAGAQLVSRITSSEPQFALQALARSAQSFVE